MSRPLGVDTLQPDENARCVDNVIKPDHVYTRFILTIIDGFDGHTPSAMTGLNILKSISTPNFPVFLVRYNLPKKEL